MEGLVTLNKREQKRLMVLNHVEKGKMWGREAAVVLGISLRHVRRLLRAKVEVQQAFDSSISVYYQGHSLDTRLAPPEAAKLRETANQGISLKASRQYVKPAPDHPWRRWVYRANME